MHAHGVQCGSRELSPTVMRIRLILRDIENETRPQREEGVYRVSQFARHEQERRQIAQHVQKFEAVSFEVLNQASTGEMESIRWKR